MGKSSAAKMVLVMMESLAGTGHKMNRLRPKTADKLEMLWFDPWVQDTVLYKEVKKIRTLKSRGGKK